MDEQDLAWIEESGKVRTASMLTMIESARQRMRRLLLLADRLDDHSNLCAEAAREIRQLCEWFVR